jgi:hypothetical protein
MGEDLKGLEMNVWKVELLPIISNWGHKESKHMVGFSFKVLEFGLSLPRIQKLYKFGLRILMDLWKVESLDFHSLDELKILFPLEEREYSC